MQNAQPSLLARDDTFLGVCEAIGEDFGFNANWLRVALAAGLMWNPEAILAFYFGLGVVVLLSRLVFPKPRAAKPVGQPVEAPAEAELEPERLAA